MNRPSKLAFAVTIAALLVWCPLALADSTADGNGQDPPQSTTLTLQSSSTDTMIDLATAAMNLLTEVALL